MPVGKRRWPQSRGAHPAVSNSNYDIQMLLSATDRLRDRDAITIPGTAFLGNLRLNRLDKTQISALLRGYGTTP